MQEVINGDHLENVTISSKFQVIIPESIRISIALKPRDKMIIFEKDGIIYLVKKQQISELKGKFSKLTSKELRDDNDRIN